MSDRTLIFQDWININEFAQRANWSILFDVNVLKRNKKNKWSRTNAKRLLEFSHKRGYDTISFELGNEPNSLKHQLDFELPPEILGKDFIRLRKLLDRFPSYRNSTLVGPDVNQLRAQGKKTKVQKALKYLGKVFLNSQQKQNSVLDALTWHQYYFDGHKAKLEDFLSAEPLDYLPKMFETVSRFLKENRIEKPLWLGETSSAYGGGAKGLSDR